MAAKKQSPPSLTADERQELTRLSQDLLRQIQATMLTHNELRTDVDPAAERRRQEAQIDRGLVQRIEEILRPWEQNKRDALDSVREDKRNLYRNPAVRWWIEQMQSRAKIPGDPMESRDFFRDLSLAVKVGVGRDRRMEKGFDWRPVEWVEHHVRQLRGQKRTWSEIAGELNLKVDESQLRRWAKRHGVT